MVRGIGFEWGGVLISLLLGCSGGGDDDKKSAAPTTISDACDQYCELQMGCRKSQTNTECLNTCNDPSYFAPCDTSYLAMKACMIEQGLFCDEQGYPAVGEECFSKVDAFISCDLVGSN